MKQSVREFMFFQTDINGLPIEGSNVTTNTRPKYKVSTITLTSNGPTPDALKQVWPGARRFFIQINTEGVPVDGTLIFSLTVPDMEEVQFLELFANGVLTLPLGENQDAGAIPDDPEDVAEIPVYMSEEYRQNGFSFTQLDKRPVVIKKTSYVYELDSNGVVTEISYLDPQGVFTRYTSNNETHVFCAIENSVTIVSGQGTLQNLGIVCNS